MIKLLLLSALLASPASVSSAPLGANSLPGQLAPWVNWVNNQHPTRFCQSGTLSGEQCLLYNNLVLKANDSGAVFELSGQNRALNSQTVELPGTIDSARLVNISKEYPVIEDAGHFYALVPAGAFRIKGELAWSKTPSTLAIPPQVGLMDLSYNGKRLYPAADNDRQIVLKSDVQVPVAAIPTANRDVYMQILQQVRVGRPDMVETRYNLNCSRRDELVELPLPKGVLIESVEADGQLFNGVDTWSYRCPQGRSSVKITGRMDGGVNKLTGLESKQENVRRQNQVVVFVPNTARWESSLKSHEAIQIEAADVDGLPADWIRESFATVWKLDGNGELSWENKAVNFASDEQARIKLDRTYYFSDMPGVLHVMDTLNISQNKLREIGFAAPNFSVQGIKKNGADELIYSSSGDAGDKRLVVLNNRNETVRFSSFYNFEAPSSAFPSVITLPVSGYDQSIQSGSVTLEMLPGWIPLFTLNGHDVSGSYWQYLSLYSLLLSVLAFVLVYLACWRAPKKWLKIMLALSGALLTLFNSWVDDYFRMVLWIPVLVMFMFISLLGRLGDDHAVMRRRCRIFAIIVVIPLLGGLAYSWPQFMLSARHPSLDSDYTPNSSYQYAMTSNKSSRDNDAPRARRNAMGSRKMASAPMESMDEYAKMAVEEEAGMPVAQPMMAKAAPMGMAANSPAPQLEAKRVKPIGVTPSRVTGGRRVSMSYSSPLRGNSDFKVVVVPPFWRGIAMFVYLALACWILLMMLGFNKSWVGKKAVKSLLPLLILLPGMASAQTLPDKAWLDELAKVTAPVSCQGSCQYLRQLEVKISSDNSYSMNFIANSAVGDLLALPGYWAVWQAESVLVNGQSAPVLRQGQLLYALVPAGTSNVTVKGRLADGAVTLFLPNGVSGLEVKAANWHVDAELEDSYRAGVVLPLLAVIEEDIVETATEIPENDNSALPLEYFVEVSRDVNIGEQNKMTTTITARGLKNGQVLEIPLQEGEIPENRSWEIHDGKLRLVAVGYRLQVSYGSSLKSSPTVTLQAAADSHIMENWTLSCNKSFECAPTGLTDVGNESGFWKFEPNPGQSLSIKNGSRPVAAGNIHEGRDWRLNVKPGVGSVAYTLKGTIYEATMEKVTLELPTAAVVERFSLNNRDSHIRPENGRLVMQLGQGTNEFELSYSVDHEVGAVDNVAPFKVDIPLVDTVVEYEPAKERVTLLILGDAVYRSVVSFWGILLAYILLALVLFFAFRQLLPDLPMKLYQWFLLLLPLAASDISFMIWLVVCLIILALPMKKKPKVRYFRLIGLVVVLLLLASALIAISENALLHNPDMSIRTAVPRMYNGVEIGWLLGYMPALAGLPELGVFTMPLWGWKIIQFVWCVWLLWCAKGWYPLVADRFAAALHHEEPKAEAAKDLVKKDK